MRYVDSFAYAANSIQVGCHGGLDKYLDNLRDRYQQKIIGEKEEQCK